MRGTRSPPRAKLCHSTLDDPLLGPMHLTADLQEQKGTPLQPYPGKAGEELPLYVGCCFFLVSAGDLLTGAEELMTSGESSPPSSPSETTGWPNPSTK